MTFDARINSDLKTTVKPDLAAAISYSIYWRERTRLDVWFYTVSRLREIHGLALAIEDFLGLTGAPIPANLTTSIASILGAARKGDYKMLFSIISKLESRLKASYNRALASQWILTSARVTVSLAGIIALFILLIDSFSIMEALLYIVALGFALSSILAFKSSLYTNLLLLSSMATSLSALYSPSYVNLLTAAYLLVSSLALREVGGVLVEWVTRPLRQES